MSVKQEEIEEASAAIPECTTTDSKDGVEAPVEYFEVEAFLPGLLQSINQMRLAKVSCDVRLKVDSTVIPAHRLVLTAASPFFMAMFSNSWSEKNAPEIVLRGVKPATVQVIVDYMYSGKAALSAENVQQVLSASNMYQLQKLKVACGEFISKMLHVANTVGILCLADDMGLVNLRWQALQFTLQNFEEVVQFEEILRMPKACMIEVFSSDSMNVKDEETVYRLALKWLSDNTERHADVDDIMEHVRFPFMTVTFLRDWVFEHKLIQKSPKCRELVEEALWYQLMPKSRKRALWTSRTKPRYHYRLQKKHTSVSSDAVITTVRGNFLGVFDIPLGGWANSRGIPLPTELYGFATAHMDSNLYVAGGRPMHGEEADAPTKNVWKHYDSNTTGQWIQLADMKHARTEFSLVVIDNTLYAVGGNDGPFSCERYNNNYNNWRICERLPLYD